MSARARFVLGLAIIAGTIGYVLIMSGCAVAAPEGPPPPSLVPELRARPMCDAGGHFRGLVVRVTAPGVYTIEFDVDGACGPTT